jgi:hypothetical protein
VTVLNTGSTKQYADGWQQVFGDKKKAKVTKQAMKRTTKTKPPKRTAKAMSQAAGKGTTAKSTKRK